MRGIKTTGICLLLAFIITGCGEPSLEACKQEYQYHHIYAKTTFNTIGDSYTIAADKSDHFNQAGYVHQVYNVEGRWDSLKKQWDANQALYLCDINAYTKRKAAILLGRSCIGYNLSLFDYNKNYKAQTWWPFGEWYKYKRRSTLIPLHFDGVSNVLYNTAYIFSIPAKYLHGFRVRNKLGEYVGWAIGGAIYLIIAGVIAAIMIPVGFVVGTICHPLQTLANLSFGIDWDNFSSYISYTNILASLWDLLYGAMLVPLLDILLLLWGAHTDFDILLPSYVVIPVGILAIIGIGAKTA